MNSTELHTNSVSRLNTTITNGSNVDGEQSKGSLVLNSDNNVATETLTAISIAPSSFRWSLEDEKPCLQEISLSIKKGKLVAVVGSVGAGKSSLLSAILGEMFSTPCSDNSSRDPPIVLRGTVAYAAQQAWIQNATVRDNILFNKIFKDELYHKVIDACSLRSDLEILTSGDQTEIGEKGINLSGGQKQRVSLARAAYSDSDIYLLDDPYVKLYPVFKRKCFKRLTFL